jgi:predicted nucleic acid-binding protein
MGYVPNNAMRLCENIFQSKIHARLALEPRDAMALLEHMAALGQHIFWEDGISLIGSSCIARARIQGHLQVTDAYLLGLAISRGGCLATFDQGIGALAREQEDRAAITIIPAP